MLWFYDNKRNIRITEKGGINPKATNHSVELIKKLYHVMKLNHLFYNFQLSFVPLEGLQTPVSILPKKLEIGDIRYNVDYCKGTNIPQLIYDLYAIRIMLVFRNSKNNTDFRLVSQDEVLGLYAKHYYSTYKQTNKIKINELAFKFIVGVIGLFLFTAMLFFLLFSVLKPMVVLVFGLFIFTISVICIALLLFSK